MLSQLTTDYNSALSVYGDILDAFFWTLYSRVKIHTQASSYNLKIKSLKKSIYLAGRWWQMGDRGKQISVSSRPSLCTRASSRTRSKAKEKSCPEKKNKQTKNEYNKHNSHRYHNVYINYHTTSTMLFFLLCIWVYILQR